MATDNIEALEALLGETERAHGVYETAQLHGVYDKDWPRWYARYAVDHGIGALLGRDVTADELARFLASGWDESQRADPKPAEPWAAYAARQIAAGL